MSQDFGSLSREPQKMQKTVRVPESKVPDVQVEGFRAWFSGLIAQSRAEGHVEGFVSAYAHDYSQTSNQAARVLNSLLTSVEGYLKEKFSDQAAIRYSCNAKHSSIKIAVTIPEEVYIERYDELYTLLSGIEKAVPSAWPQLSNFIIDSVIATFSPEIPIDTEALGRDFPYTTQAT